MPNIPALVNASACVFASGKHCTEDDVNLTKKLFKSIGTVEEIPESMFEVATAVNGAGPAYVSKLQKIEENIKIYVYEYYRRSFVSLFVTGNLWN